MARRSLFFGDFRFDPADRRLEGPSGAVRLNPKAFEVLRALVERRGSVVSKDELLDDVWPETHVSDGVLKVSIAEIRSALGDSARAPRFIETVHRYGYRFIAEVSVEGAAAWPGASASPASPVGLVGREAELALLQQHLARALRGERQTVFVTGEPGIGKTALDEHFVAGAARHREVSSTGGQCLEQLGAAEAYMPVLDAVGRLVREEGRARALLRRYAPAWLSQLPWLVEADDADKLRLELLGGTRERMLRELAEFVEALTAETPLVLVLVLEDLQWCDPSTVDVVSLLAERREPARLLVLATYRPVDLILTEHPLRTVAQRLAAKQRCAEITLDELRLPAVAVLARRFGGSRFAGEIAPLLRERTDGNPLFLVTLVDRLLARGAIVEHEGRFEVTEQLRSDLAEVPETVRLLIGQQVARLGPEDRELLEGASLVGMEFTAAVAAEAAAREPARAEQRFDHLADAAAFLRRVGAGQPQDGASAAPYAFRHALYRETLAAAVPVRRRAEAELRIGLALERAGGERVQEIAAGLAVHFEQGGDRMRAAHYRRLAARTAAHRHALAEAEAHLERGVALLAGLTASPERDREELLLQSALGGVRMATRGYAAGEVERAFRRALELASSLPQEPSAFEVLAGLLAYSVVRGELDRALELAERLRGIAQTDGNSLMRLMAHHGLWTVHFFRGDLAEALRHLDEGEPLYDLIEDRIASLVTYGQDPKVAALALRAILLWHIGYADQALARSRQAVEHARSLGHPMSIAYAMSFAGWLRIMRREPHACLEQAEAVIAYATEQGMPHWVPATLHARGWARAALGELEQGIADMEHGLAYMAAIGERLGRSPRLNDLVAAKLRAGHLEEARALLEESRTLADATGEHYQDPETLQTEGELILAEAAGPDGSGAEARGRVEGAFRAAIESAKREGARALELRALLALARLCRSGEKGRQVRADLAELLAWFDEGLDTPDLEEARRLLEIEPEA